MRAAFTKHPASVGESYSQHMRVAASFGTRMLVTALAVYVHAIFPFLFERTGSSAITELYDRMMVARRRTHRDAGAQAEPSIRQAVRQS